ncbi:phosphoadenosine phosphosulfate reductase [Zalerion maritima]|uniref:FAD synthase n=1 Tax=Zalerion maritima TaxID=339359 RepID=A0AAD5RQN6_9PEZI|nr:phosphoadenosine phosphosulfate reductase [Zalerion maritima]
MTAHQDNTLSTSGSARTGATTMPPTVNGASANGSAKESCPSTTERSQKLRTECLALQAKVNGFLEEEVLSPRLRGVQQQVRIAMGVIKQALEEYSLEELSLSYNGGKDCLVLLVLVLATLPSVYTSVDSFPSCFQSVYVVSKHPFREVDDFVEATAGEYCLDLKRYSMGMKQALQSYLDDRPKLRAVFVGTRRTDPHGAKLKHFDETDADWPEFMRIHPVIDWHYVEIWGFIRHLKVPYCALYDQGYTSLGGTTDTHPNPALKVIDKVADKGVSRADLFRPAYELYEDDAERLGRD